MEKQREPATPSFTIRGIVLRIFGLGVWAAIRDFAAGSSGQQSYFGLTQLAKSLTRKIL
jgi:hypothetical protein